MAVPICPVEQTIKLAVIEGLCTIFLIEVAAD